MPTDPARTAADRRFLALRASGFTGPADQDGYPETDPAILAIFASLDQTTTRLMAAVRTGGGGRG
jgi:hypothetical protein